MKFLPINLERFREAHRVEINSAQQTFTEKLLCARHLAGDEWLRDPYDRVSTLKVLQRSERNGILGARCRLLQTGVLLTPEF